MKKLSMFVAAIALAVPVPLTFATPANAENEWVGFCKDYVGAGYDANLNRGECISLLNAQEHYITSGKNRRSYSVHACDYYAENHPYVYDAYGWETKQDCVAWFMANL